MSMSKTEVKFLSTLWNGHYRRMTRRADRMKLSGEERIKFLLSRKAVFTERGYTMLPDGVDEATLETCGKLPTKAEKAARKAAFKAKVAAKIAERAAQQVAA